MSFSATFLGTGAASNQGLGNAACLLEYQQKPWLLIDCGHDTLQRFQSHTGLDLPEFVFITHLHFDHIAGLEQLFFQSFRHKTLPVVYVPVALVEKLTQILSHTGLAEGGINLWQQLRVVPVLETFWHQGQKLHCYPVRHHQPGSAYCLHVPGLCLFTGDTRPIPEIINHKACYAEVIFHDCNVKGNPSHSGVGDLLYEYSPDVLQRIWAYHYYSHQEADKIRAQGIKVVKPGERILLDSSANIAERQPASASKC